MSKTLTCVASFQGDCWSGEESAGNRQPLYTADIPCRTLSKYNKLHYDKDSAGQKINSRLVRYKDFSRID